MEPPEEPPSTSEHPVIKEEPDDEGPPNLLIDEDDDDGYPNTPPVLERQDYYIENEEEDPAPAFSNAPPVPNRFFNYESEFYLPHNLRRLNPSKYVPHSHHFLLDLICILCQRVCNETHAVSCFANHRFCKDCIRPRLEKYGFCPRCGDKALGDAKPDPTYDKIIERMRYNKDEVNYVCLDPEREDQELSDFERDTSEEDSDSPDDGSYFRPTPPPVKPLSEQRHEFGEFMEKEIKRVRAAREADAKIEDEEVLKRKRLLQKRVSLSACPPYKYMQEHQLFDIVGDMPPQNSRNLLLETNRDGLKAGVHDVEDWMLPVKQSPRFATYLPPRWNPLNLQKPLQNMVYKTFWFNKDIEWPKNEPVPHPLGLTPTRLRDHKLMGKARRRIGNDPFLSKREKKISLHKFFTTQLEENLELSEFSSSSDDDEPPPKFCQFPFDYPSNYRKPRKDWRLLYDEEGNVRSGVKAKTRNTERVVFDRMARRWKKEWGEPLQLLRESSTQCAIPFKDLKRCYLGAPKHATIGHIQDYVYRKIALLRSLKLQYVKKRFRVNLHPVLWHGSGKNVEVIQCTDTQLPGQVKSPVKPALQQPPSAPPVLPKEISIYQNRTPTVRDLAIKTMNMGIKINPIVMDEAQVVQLQHAINITESPEKPKGKNAYQYKPRNPRQSCSKQELGAPRSASSTVLTLINSTPMNGISGRPTLAVAPYQPSTPTTLTNTSQHVPLVSPLVSLTNGQTPIIHSAPAMLIPTSMKTPTSVESTKQSAPALPTPGSVDGPPLLTPIGRPSVKLNEPNPEVDKFFTPPPNQPVVNTNPLLNLEGKEGLLHRMMGHEPAKRPALQPRVLANGLTQANAIALARALPPGATLTGVPGLRPSLLYPAPIGGAARTGFQTIKLSGPSTSVNDAPINLVPVVTQGDHIQYMQLTPDGKCIPLHASTLGGNILAITPPKGGINGAPQAPTFLKPMTSRDGRPYLQQVEPIIMQQQPQPPPPPPPPPPSAPTLQGAATGRRLSRKVTAFFINTPHVRLDLNVKIGDLRKQAKLKKGGRLVLVFSIHDLKCDQETDLTVPRGIPSLRKRRLRRYRSSIEKRPRYSGSSSDEGVDKKEEEEEDEDEDEEDEEEEKKEVKEEENEEKQEESDDEEDEGEEADD